MRRGRGQTMKRHRIAVVLASLIASYVAGCQTDLRDSRMTTYKVETSRRNVTFLAQMSKNLKKSGDAWPERIPDVIDERIIKYVGKDGWGNDVVYSGYSPERGFGTVTSYGADAKPGGEGPDEDIEARFDWSECDSETFVTTRTGTWCRVHGATMLPDTVPIHYGLITVSPEGHFEAASRLFPNAQIRSLGGCCVGERKQRRVLYCPDCRSANKAWVSSAVLPAVSLSSADSGQGPVDAALDRYLEMEELRPIDYRREGVDQDWVRTFAYFERLLNTGTNTGIKVYLSADLLSSYSPISHADAVAANLLPRDIPPEDGGPEIPYIGVDAKITARQLLDQLSGFYGLWYTVTKRGILIDRKVGGRRHR